MLTHGATPRILDEIRSEFSRGRVAAEGPRRAETRFSISMAGANFNLAEQRRGLDIVVDGGKSAPAAIGSETFRGRTRDVVALRSGRPLILSAEGHSRGPDDQTNMPINRLGRQVPPDPRGLATRCRCSKNEVPVPSLNVGRDAGEAAPARYRDAVSDRHAHRGPRPWSRPADEAGVGPDADGGMSVRSARPARQMGAYEHSKSPRNPRRSQRATSRRRRRFPVLMSH